MTLQEIQKLVCVLNPSWAKLSRSGKKKSGHSFWRLFPFKENILSPPINFLSNWDFSHKPVLMPSDVA